MIIQLKKIYFKKQKISNIFVKIEKNEKFKENEKFENLLRNLSWSHSYLILLIDYFSQRSKDCGDDKDNYFSYICAFCLVKKADCVNRPCNHGGFCKNCSIVNFDKGGLCPLCRNRIEHIVIYSKGGDRRNHQIGQYP